MTTKLHRTFPSRERFLADFVRDLSEREMEVDLPGGEALATGETVDLNLRLDDGSPLLVGTGMVVGGEGEAGGAFRIRFLGLTDTSRGVLDELLAERPSDAGGREERAPADLDETLEDLVAGAFGERRRPSPDETTPTSGAESVFVPPASIPERPEPRELPPELHAEADAASDGESGPESRAEAPEAEEREPAPDGAPPGEPPRPTRKRTIWERLQVSPAVIVASLIAGVTGAAADYWFEELAGFVVELRAADTAIEEAPVIDIPPAGVKPSDFSVPTPAPTSAEPLPASTTSPDAPPAEPASPAPPTAEGAAREPTEDRVGAGSSAEPEDAPADRVRLITWDEEPTGTVVTFWGNGPFLRERVIRHRVQGGAPRELVKLRGIDLPYRQTVVPVDTPELVRIRTGFHPQDRVNELHVVLDLAGSEIELTRADASENRLRLHLEAVGSGEGTPTPRAPAQGGE